MTTDQQLQSLLDYKGGKILSVYLDTDLTDKSKDAVRLMFRQQTEGLEDAATEEIERIQQYLDFEYDWLHRGVAIFCSSDAYWVVTPLPVSVPTQVVYGERPNVRLLADVQDRFGKYDVAVLDRQRVRLFSVDWGRIQSATETVGEELKRHKQGGWSAAGYQRHEDNIALHNLKQGIEIIERFCERTGSKRLLLGGSPEVISQVKEMMPNPLQEQFIGEFVVDVTASANEVLTRSLDLMQTLNRERETRLVREAITEAAKGGLGVTGLTDTLFALHQGQVRLLLVDAEYRAEGYVCENCGFVLTEQKDACPLCQGTEWYRSQDVVNAALHKAADTGAEVNLVHASEELREAGSIAAITRY